MKLAVAPDSHYTHLTLTSMKKLLTSILIINALNLSAQEILISFQPKVVGTKIDSIWVTNQATLEKVKLHGADTLVLTKATSNKTIPAYSSEGHLYPNPCHGNASFTFQSLISQEVEVRIYNISGQLMGIRKQKLSAGNHRFQMSFPDIGLYTVSVLKLDGSFTQKAINLSSKRLRCNIEYTGTSDQTTLKSASAKKTMVYSEGDILLYSVFSGRNNTYMTDSPVQSKTVGVEFYECIDADNNDYAVVKIGDQIWMAENLKTTKFTNGDSIPYAKFGFPFSSSRKGEYCWSNNDMKNKNIYGALYGIPTFWFGEICPEGWYCPNNTDWATLRDYLGGSGEAGGKMKSVTGWKSPNTNASNSSGFSALPTGTMSLNFDGNSEGFGEICVFGSVSRYAIVGGPEHMSWGLIYLSGGFIGGGNNSSIEYFLSVRCLRKNASITTVVPDSITTTSAILGGSITNEGWGEILERGICLDTSKTPSIENHRIVLGEGIGAFKKKVTGLIPGTAYHVRAYATNSVGTSYGEEYIFSTLYGSVTDVDGNVYPTVKLGNQIWMAEDLKTTKYRDGNPLPFVQDNNSWDDLTEGAYKEYTYTTSNPLPFSEVFTNRGIFYNWYAVETGKLCPYGWHVPAQDEWFGLYVNPAKYAYDGNFYNITKALAAKTGWSQLNPYYNQGDPGDDLSKNNSTGFSAMPTHSTSNMSEDCYWWTATEENETNANSFYLWGFGNSNLGNISSFKNNGFTIRCVKNTEPMPLVTTAAPDSIIGRSVILGGTVIYEGLSEIIECGICYSTQRSPTFKDFLVPIGKGVGVFKTKVMGFADNTTYYARAYAINSQDTVYGVEVAFIIGNNNQTSKFIDPRDNKEYKTIKIGDQWWMAENLAYLPEVSPPTSGSDTIKHYYVYGYSGTEIGEAKSSHNYLEYGVLYNWAAAKNSCPEGWHLPSSTELTNLEKYMIEHGYNYDGTTRYNKLGKSLASQAGWDTYNVAGTPGYEQGENNRSGFCGMPGGVRDKRGEFGDLGRSGNWWASTNYPPNSANGLIIRGFYEQSLLSSDYTETGRSVRCIKD